MQVSSMHTHTNVGSRVVDFCRLRLLPLPAATASPEAAAATAAEPTKAAPTAEPSLSSPKEHVEHLKWIGAAATATLIVQCSTSQANTHSCANF